MKRQSERRGVTREEWHRLPGGRRALLTVYLLLRLFVVLVLIAQVLNRDFESVFLCILTLILFLVPSFVERRFQIDIPDTLEVMILLFIYAAEILGEIRAYYITFPYWDIILHTLNGFLCAAIGFSLVELLNRSSKPLTFTLSPAYMALVAFCFSMTVGVLWEFFECVMDQLFLLDMQKDCVVNAISSVMLNPDGARPAAIQDIADVIVVHSDGTQQALGLGGYLDIGLLDTMSDLFVNFIGAVTFSVIGFVYIKRQGKGRFARWFIPTPHPAAEKEEK